MAEAAKLPFDLFTTRDLERRDRFEAWRHNVSPVFDVAGPDGASAGPDFEATLASYHLGNVILTAANFDAQRFQRSRRKIAIDGLDHYQVQLYATGGEVGLADGHDLAVRPGDVQILDLGRSVVTATQTCKTVALFIPRDVLHAALPTPPDLHGLVLRGDGGAGGLLADYMAALVGRAASMTTADAPLVAHATAALVAACARPTAETIARAQQPIDSAIGDRIRRHIDRRLGEDELGADMLCRTFGISRTTLYRLFEADGGVLKYIQGRRLRRAMIELGSPVNHRRRILDIALDWGFSSEAHFSRMFRRTYGMSPSDARYRGRADPAETTSDGHGAESDLGDWIVKLQPR